MKKAVYLLLIFLLASCGNDKTSRLSTEGSQGIGVSTAKVNVQSILSGMEKGKYREGELLVKFRSGIVASASSKTHQAVGATSLKRFSIVPNLEHVKLAEGLSVKNAIKQYMSDPNVEYAEPNYLKRATMLPNDTFFAQQWGLTKINAPGAWDITTGSSSVIVAVLDTGIDPTHPDLAVNVIQGENFVPKPPTTDTTDDNGHGTHVSGIIGAVGNNSVGVAGLMWHVGLMPVKFLAADGTGDTADEISAVDFAVAHGAKVINASFAGAGFGQSEYEAIARANAAGVLLIAAAGNGSGAFCSSVSGTDTDSSPCYPASFSNPNDQNLVRSNLPALLNVISVAATDQNDNLASFSNFGRNSVQVAAPGVNVLSTIPLNLPPCSFHPFASNYDFCDGTSQATPHVSGLAGLLYSQNPNLSYLQVRSIIFNNVDVLPSLNNRILTSGRINAFRALTSAIVPKIAVSPTSKDFGTVNAGSSSSPQTFTVSNSGTANLVINQIALTGANAAEFSLSGDGCSGQAIAPFLNCTIQAKFSPASAGAKNAVVSISSNNTTAPTVNVSLVGTGAVPQISVSPINADFGTVTVGSTSPTRTFTISNGGTANLIINQITLTGVNAAEFSLSGDGCSGKTIAPFLNCTIQGKFSPTSSGAKSATISIPSNDTAAPTANVSLAGTGAVPPSPSGGGGGGCSIGAKQDTPTAIADLAVIFMPLLLLAVVRRRRQFRMKR